MKSTELHTTDVGDLTTDRQRLLRTRDLTLGGLMGALGIVLPIAFHALGPGVGPVLLPMYLPLLALGLLASWEVAVVVGVLTPLLSSVLTGMPPLAPPLALLMAFELGALATGASLARRAGLGVWPACVAGLFAARLCGLLALLTIGRALGYNATPLQYALFSLATAWPGIVLQLTVVPAAVAAVERVSLLGPRFRKDTP